MSTEFDGDVGVFVEQFHQLLDEAVAWCEERGVRFYAVNSNFDEDANCINSDNFCRKLKVQMFIDDRNVGGLPDWGSIYQIIHSGLLTSLDERKASTTCRRFRASVLRCWLESLLARSRSS